MNFILEVLFNKSSKYNKAIVAVLTSAVSVAYILGYPDIAVKIAAIGGAIGVTLIGNPKDVVVVSPENPSASA